MKTYEEANKAVEKIEEEALQQVKLITDEAEERVSIIMSIFPPPRYR